MKYLVMTQIIYMRGLKVHHPLKMYFKDLGTGVSGKTTDNGYDAIVSILAEADPDRYMIYSFFGTVTPDMGKPSRLLIEPQPYTIKGQDFSAYFQNYYIR